MVGDVVYKAMYLQCNTKKYFQFKPNYIKKLWFLQCVRNNAKKLHTFTFYVSLLYHFRAGGRSENWGGGAAGRGKCSAGSGKPAPKALRKRAVEPSWPIRAPHTHAMRPLIVLPAPPPAPL